MLEIIGSQNHKIFNQFFHTCCEIGEPVFALDVGEIHHGERLWGVEHFDRISKISIPHCDTTVWYVCRYQVRPLVNTAHLMNDDNLRWYFLST